jgi:hypothetical protein
MRQPVPQSTSIRPGSNVRNCADKPGLSGLVNRSFPNQKNVRFHRRAGHFSKRIASWFIKLRLANANIQEDQQPIFYDAGWAQKIG